MKNIFTTILLLLSFTAFTQTTMTVHTAGGSTDYLLSDVDSITYDTPGGGGTTVGGNGPAGGIVFYDKGSYSDGWRYLEVMLNDLNSAEWGCYAIDITGTSDAIGAGETNTATIINQCTTPGTAAKICSNYSISNGGTTYDDWFLPSIEELNLVYNFIINNPSVNLNIFGSSYWSSTQFDSNFAWVISTSNGSYGQNDKYSNSPKTRGIRKF